jgi:Restriction endonuclease S subunits
MAEIIKKTYLPNNKENLKYIGLEHIEEGKLRLNSIGISSEVKSTKYLFKAGDILFGKLRPYFRKVVKVNFDGVCSTDIWVIVAKQGVDQSYLFYFLANWDFINLATYGEGGTRMPRADWNFLKQIEFPLPPLPEQKAIADVLSGIDDKIELLHRQNKTLEEMAMTLFRQWFIEPTKDGLPEGWEEVSLGEFFPVITGKKDANFATDNGLYPFFTCSQKPLKAPSYSFDGNAILLAGNGDFNIKRYRGKFEAYQRTYVLIPYNPEYFNFLYLLMKFYLDDITGSYKGSVINYITKDMIEDFKFSLPKDRTSIIDKLLYFDSIYEKVDANTSQIQTLEKLRDTLLPKLMSGEIRVKI